MKLLVFGPSQRTILLWLFVAAVGIVTSWGASPMGRAYAQGESPPASESMNLAGMQAAMERTLESQAKSLIERHLRPEEFQVLITVEGKAFQESELPYVPSTLDVHQLKDLAPSELKPYIQRVNVEILLADRFKDLTKTKIKDLLTKKLALDTARGDRITFSSLGIELDQAPSELALALSRAEAESRDIQAKVAALAKERDDSQRELSTTKTALETLKSGNIQKLGEIMESTRKEIDGRLKENVKGVQDDKKSSDKTFLEQNIGVITAGLLILLALLLLGVTSRYAVTALARSFVSIGESVRGFGEKVAEALASQTPAAGAGSQGDRGGEGSAAKRTPSADEAPRPGSGASLEAMQARILVLHNDLLQSMTPATEGIVLAHVGRLLESGDTAAKGVVTMELLGKDKANEIFQLLDSESQSIVRDFMRSGSYPKPKADLMLEAAEELKTKLLMAVFGEVRGSISEKVASRILKLRIDGLAMVAKNLSAAALPRLFLYLEPRRVAEVLSALRSLDEGKYTASLRALAKVPEAERATDIDAEIIAVLDDQITVANDDTQRAYFNWYKAIAESVDEDLAEEMRNQLASASPQLGRYVRDQMITFGTFFLLLEEIQEELVGGLSNKSLAALLSGLSDQQKARILSYLDQRRQEVVAEEIENLASKGQRQAKVAHRQAKNLIIANLKALKGSGSLDEFIDKQSAPASGTASNLSEKGSFNAA